jgi:hypothetical protein
MSPNLAPLRAPPIPAHAIAEHDRPHLARRPRTIGRLRLPIAGPYAPWATLYELPDGRRMWCVRLWEIDRPVRRCLPTGLLVAFARLNGLHGLRREIEAMAARP